MNRAFCILASLSFVAAASADMRIFLSLGNGSDVGLDNFASAPVPTVSQVDEHNNNFNAYDYANADYTPGLHTINQTAAADFGYATGNGTFPQSTAGSPWLFVVGQTVYVWLQFNRNDHAAYSPSPGDRLTHLSLKITGIDVTTAWYLQNDGVFARNKRWDGPATPPGYPEFISSTAPENVSTADINDARTRIPQVAAATPS